MITINLFTGLSLGYEIEKNKNPIDATNPNTWFNFINTKDNSELFNEIINP